MKKILILFSAIMVFASCEEVPVIIPTGGGGPIDTMDNVVKKVLLEELTGVSCPNCPAGTAALEGILSVFGDRVIANAIHGQFLAQPTAQSLYDFRNEDAKNLELALGPLIAKPAAVIDRVHFEGQDFQSVVTTGIWQALVMERLELPALAAIELTSEYNEATRRANITVTVTAVEDIIGNVKLSVVTNESHMIDAQLDQNVVLDTYEHNHVMRHMLTSINGDLIATDMAEGESLTFDYTYTVPAESNGEWVADNMEVIAFVTSSFFDDHVMQVEAVHLN